MLKNRIISTSLLSLAFGALASAATITTFADRTNYMSEQTTRGLQTNSPLNLAGLVQTGNSIVVPQIVGGGVTVTPLDSTQLVVADQDAPGYDFGAPQVFSAQLGFPAMLRFDFGSGTFGFGFDVSGFPALSDPINLSVDVVSGGATQTFAFPGVGGPSLSFVGLVSDMAIISVLVTGSPIDPVFANIATGTAGAAAIPEPGTASLVTLAAGALLFWRRRTSRRTD